MLNLKQKSSTLGRNHRFPSLGALSAPPIAERLELRLMFDVCDDIIYKTGIGQLAISGTEFSDTINVNYEGNNIVGTLTAPLWSCQRSFPKADIIQVQIGAGDGDDSVILEDNITQPAVIGGDRGDDTIKGGAGNDELSGEYGDDHIEGRGGNDSINGDQDNDQLWGDAGDDKINGGDGFDMLNGGDGNDFLCGGEDDDTIFGGAGNDVIDGDGDYRLQEWNGRHGSDNLMGDDGDDSFINMVDGEADTVDGGNHIIGDSVDSHDGNDTLTNIEYGAD